MTWRPVVALLLVAPFLGEVLSTATAPLDLLLPWNLALFAALYGGGALLCRELAHRWRLGLSGLVLLGAAYGVFEEALVDRFWFDRAYAAASGVGDYARVGDTSLLLAVHLTAFHAAVSVSCSVLVVTWLFPDDRERAWLRPRGLFVVAGAMLLVLFFTYEQFVAPPPGPTLVAVAVGALLVAAARWSGRGAESGRPTTTESSADPPVPARCARLWLVGVVAFGCTAAHFVLTYAVPSTGLPWPAGLALAVAPLLIGVPAGRGRLSTDPRAFAVVAGILGFFVLLVTLVGLGGRYDRTVAGVLTAGGLVWLRRRVHRHGPAARLSSRAPPDGSAGAGTPDQAPAG